MLNGLSRFMWTMLYFSLIGPLMPSDIYLTVYHHKYWHLFLITSCSYALMRLTLLVFILIGGLIKKT